MTASVGPASTSSRIARPRTAASGPPAVAGAVAAAVVSRHPLPDRQSVAGADRLRLAGRPSGGPSRRMAGSRHHRRGRREMVSVGDVRARASHAGRTRTFRVHGVPSRPSEGSRGCPPSDARPRCPGRSRPASISSSAAIRRWPTTRRAGATRARAARGSSSVSRRGTWRTCSRTSRSWPSWATRGIPGSRMPSRGCRPSKTRMAGGSTSTPTTARPGSDIERQGQPSKWVTLRACRFLRAALA